MIQVVPLVACLWTVGVGARVGYWCCIRRELYSHLSDDLPEEQRRKGASAAARKRFSRCRIARRPCSSNSGSSCSTSNNSSSSSSSSTTSTTTTTTTTITTSKPGPAVIVRQPGPPPAWDVRTPLATLHPGASEGGKWGRTGGDGVLSAPAAGADGGDFSIVMLTEAGGEGSMLSGAAAREAGVCLGCLAEGCPICLGEFGAEGEEDGQGEDCTLVTCGHVFHTACLSSWLDAHSTCPSCRQDFNKEPPANPKAAGSSRGEGEADAGVPPAGPAALITRGAEAEAGAGCLLAARGAAAAAAAAPAVLQLSPTGSVADEAVAAAAAAAAAAAGGGEVSGAVLLPLAATMA